MSQLDRGDRPVVDSTLGAPLTDLQLAVLSCAAEGMSNREIGIAIFRSKSTVETHVQALIGKLGAKNKLHAVAIGVRRGLV